MDDCTQEAMLRCMHVLSITGCTDDGHRVMTIAHPELMLR